MGSKSKAVDTTTTNTNNLALSRDAITESGTQILDSIVIDPSDEALKAMVASLEADFAVLVSGQKAGMDSFVELGQRVLDLADRNQIQMAGVAQTTLRTSLDWMREQMELGKYVIDFSAAAIDKSYDFAGQAIDRAFDIAAEVKTGDGSENLQKITGMVMVFTLLVIFMTAKRG